MLRLRREQLSHFSDSKRCFHQVLKALDGLATVRPAAQMNGVTAAIFAPLDIAVLVLMGDNLAGSSVNCECCLKTKIMQKKIF